MIRHAWSLSRRAALCGGSLLVVGVGAAEAETALERTQKFEAWVAFIRTKDVVSPMTNGSFLDFPTAEVQWRQHAGKTRDGVTHIFGVVIPDQVDGIVLAAGNAE